MKKILSLMVIVLFVFIGTAAWSSDYDSASPVKEFDLSISGTTTAFNQTSGSTAYSGVSWFTITAGSYSRAYVDLKDAKPNLGVFSIQLTGVTLAGSNTNNHTLTASNSSGATYYLYYTTSNKDNLWGSNAGITPICGPIQLSGASTVVQNFIPEFARFYKIGVLTGMTQFGNVKAVLEIQ